MCERGRERKRVVFPSAKATTALSRGRHSAATGDFGKGSIWPILVQILSIPKDSNRDFLRISRKKQRLLSGMAALGKIVLV